jgi:lipid-binding SYLF domain-containing protein
MKTMTGMFAAMLATLLAVGCTTTPPTEEKRENLLDKSQVALNEMKQADSSLNDFLNKSYGYAFFPTAGKGGLIIGGAYGRGVVYEQGNFIGYSDITQATVGAQAGGQSFSELIVFENKAALDRFTNGKFTFAANASAVALKSGAAASARYTDGVAIFVKPIAGLMAEASVGGQQFTFSRAEAPANMNRNMQ